MEQDLYEIYDGADYLVASKLELNTALILIRALYNEYYKEVGLEFTIRCMPRATIKQDA